MHDHTSAGAEPSRSRRISRRDAALLLIDLQEKLLPAIWESERVLHRAGVLAQGLQILGLPVLVTEQYRKGLGPTVESLASIVTGFAPIEKLTFSSLTPDIQVALRQRAVRDVVLAGIETHVCVAQTALDLLDAGFRVFVVAEACSSRTEENWRVGLSRMEAAGAVRVSVEMVLFELLGRAGTDEFKQILPLVK